MNSKDSSSQEERAGRDSTSFLLRVWSEPRTGEAKGGVFRGYLRNLKTGEEQYFGDPGSLVDKLKGQVDEVGLAAIESIGATRGSGRSTA